MAVACTNANGEPDIFFCLVLADEDQIDNGEHYVIAKNKASSEGYNPVLAYDKADSGQAILSLMDWSNVEPCNPEETVDPGAPFKRLSDISAIHLFLWSDDKYDSFEEAKQDGAVCSNSINGYSSLCDTINNLSTFCRLSGTQTPRVRLILHLKYIIDCRFEDIKTELKKLCQI